MSRGAADSPFYAGTIAFFGAMTAHTQMRHDVTFVVPLPKQPQVFAAPAPTAGREERRGEHHTLTIRLVPSRGQAGPAPVIKSVTVGWPAMLRSIGEPCSAAVTAALALLALVAPHGSAARRSAQTREIVLNLPRPIGAGETAFIEIEVGAIGRAQIEVTTDTGQPLGAVSPFGVRAGQDAGALRCRSRPSAIRDGRVAVRLTVQARRTRARRQRRRCAA